MKTISRILFTVFLFTILTSGANAQKWYSALYPKNWNPGFIDNEGRFLHDFSYAGYHSGLKDIPFNKNNMLNVTHSPYNADNTGRKDVTAVLQRAINDLTKKGGGVLYLPAGEYLTSISADRQIGLSITANNIVLRGDGPEKTFIKNTSTLMRKKTLIRFFSRNGTWNQPVGEEIKLSGDVLLPATTIPLEDVSSLKEGDFIILKFDITDGFREEHKVGEHWDKLTKGAHFFRKVIVVNANNNTIEIDVPTRYFLKKRDNARVYIARPQISECGIENLSIGNIEHSNPKGWGETDWNVEGTGSYDAHGSHLIEFVNTNNCWVRNVHTYRPFENKQDIHILSNCLLVTESRFITIEHCNFQKSQGEGGGGNGYLYTLTGNDCLIRDCYAEDGRHHYSFKGMNANGNVIHNCYSKDSYLSTDFHMNLSMANLIDGFQSDGDYIDAKFRSYGFANARHMYSTTESVIWNTKGIKPSPRREFLVISCQFGHGYVIGTSGKMTKVITQPVAGEERGIKYDTAPEDWVEGEGKGETLEPQSLYLDQFGKRIKRIK